MNGRTRTAGLAKPLLDLMHAVDREYVESLSWSCRRVDILSEVQTGELSGAVPSRRQLRGFSLLTKVIGGGWQCGIVRVRIVLYSLALLAPGRVGSSHSLAFLPTLFLDTRPTHPVGTKGLFLVGPSGQRRPPSSRRRRGWAFPPFFVTSGGRGSPVFNI